MAHINLIFFLPWKISMDSPWPPMSSNSKDRRLLSPRSLDHVLFLPLIHYHTLKISQVRHAKILEYHVSLFYMKETYSVIHHGWVSWSYFITICPSYHGHDHNNKDNTCVSYTDQFGFFCNFPVSNSYPRPTSKLRFEGYLRVYSDQTTWVVGQLVDFRDSDNDESKEETFGIMDINFFAFSPLGLLFLARTLGPGAAL